jgi:transcriptional regulator with GAF, ATPase, and Fis domain
MNIPDAVATPSGTSDSPGETLTLEQAERFHIVSTLKQTQWRIDGQQGAARILNVHPSTLRSRMKKLGIQRSAEESS